MNINTLGYLLNVILAVNNRYKIYKTCFFWQLGITCYLLADVGRSSGWQTLWQMHWRICASQRAGGLVCQPAGTLGAPRQPDALADVGAFLWLAGWAFPTLKGTLRKGLISGLLTCLIRQPTAFFILVCYTFLSRKISHNAHAQKSAF